MRSSTTLGQASGDSTGGRAIVGKQIVDGPVPQIQEKIVEVIKVILREQCQRVLSFDSMWDSPLPHARVGVF